MKARMVYRGLKMKNPATRQAYRSGIYAMWQYASVILTKWGIPKPGSWSKTNMMGGVCWASPAEFRRNPLSETQCALVLETCFEGGCPLSTLKLVSKACSFIYQLDTGIPSSNYGEVRGMFKTFDLKLCAAASKSLGPLRIPLPLQLKQAFTTEWRPGGAFSLKEFLIASLMAWDGWVCGLRPGCDLTKVKVSEEHFFNVQPKVTIKGLNYPENSNNSTEIAQVIVCGTLRNFKIFNSVRVEK